jgi:ferrochelatase
MTVRAVLLVNVGSPDSPSPADVRRFLGEFLSDPLMLDLPSLLRTLLVRGIILPFGTQRAAAIYQAVWRPEGCPLISVSRRVQSLLRQKLDVPVELAMRYGNPSITSVIRDLAGQGVSDLRLIPLFPQYARCTCQSVVERVREVVAEEAPSMNLRVQPPFSEDPLYIEALHAVAKEHLERPRDHLLFSFHGLPERHLRKTDPTHRHCLARPDCCETPHPSHATCYRAQAFGTVAAFVRKAGLPAGRFSVAFQSRTGPGRWLAPDTAEVLARLPSQGVKNLLVMSPSFVADCTETLEEIAIRGRRTFLDAGGSAFTYIPCLNDHPCWIEALRQFALAP